MDIYRTARASASAKAQPYLDELDPLVAQYVDAISPDALAVWDIRRHDDGPCSLHLCLCDDWSHTHCEFDRADLNPATNLRLLVENKLSTFAGLHRRVLFKVRDGTFANDDLSRLRETLNSIADIGHKGLKIENRFEYVPCNAFVPATAFKITDFTLEVDASAAGSVAEALRVNGFEIQARVRH